MGGADLGPTPFDLILGGLVSCTAITLRMYARDRDIPLEDIEVDARAEKRDDGSYEVTRRIRVVGELDDEQRAHLERVAEKTPVTRAVRDGVGLQTRWRPPAR